jgi:hypothetical protein
MSCHACFIKAGGVNVQQWRPDVGPVNKQVSMSRHGYPGACQITLPVSMLMPFSYTPLQEIKKCMDEMLEGKECWK